MPKLNATDTRVILREMNAASEALAAITALVIAGADRDDILVHVAKARAATSYGRDWFMRCDFIVSLDAEPVTIAAAA